MPSQPPQSRLDPRGLLSLPYRLCNPPPAVGKVRSCAVTPILDVRLDDVLARRHLPPIGLKDLEEYLLYVEHTPENLYFILWLKDYTARYHAWVQREKLSLVSKKEKLSKSQPQKFSIPPTPDPALAMFYLRAKQTFFTPNGEYELNIPSDILAPFHCAPHTHPQDHSRPSLWHSQSIHPDPAVFSEVALEAQHMLNESLKRFVRAAYTNVGSQRAICGIVAGCVFTFAGGILPLVLTTGRWNSGSHTRLIRLTALPGLWFGLTVLLASLQGICLMIYFFGDLRQLRKFELARPTISRPIPIPDASPIPLMSTARGQPLFVPSRSAPLPEKSLGGSPTAPSLDPPTRRYAQSSTTSLVSTSCDSCASARSSVQCDGINISPAFFDDVPAPEGPATASCLHRPEYRLSPAITYAESAHVRPPARSAGLSVSVPVTDTQVIVPRQSRRSLRGTIKSASEYGPTAGFIPNDYPNGSTTSLAETARSLRSQRSACYFDFDALPVHRHKCLVNAGGDGIALPPVMTHIPPTSSVMVADPASPQSFAPSSASSPSLTGAGALLGRAQYNCHSCPTTAFTSSFSDESLSDHRPEKRTRFSLASWIPSFTAGVPAFAAPLTLVQSPLVKRAQWEVVIRAGLLAAMVAGGLTGLVVAVVP